MTGDKGMDQKERVAIKLCIKSNADYVKKWLTYMKLFEPKEMKFKKYKNGKFVSYKKNVFGEEVDRELKGKEYDIFLQGDQNYINCIKTNNNQVIRLLAIINYSTFIDHENDIYLLINEIMSEVGIVARIVSLEDNFWQTNMDVDYYLNENKSLEGIPLKKHPIFQNEKAVDVEKLPGYETQIENIWFGAAWKMWFNDEYYQFVSREAIADFEDCYSNAKISTNCRCITLYSHVLDYNKSENRQKQWNFKSAIKFQEIVENLKQISKPMEGTVNVEILNGEFEHGGIKKILVYLDDNNNSISKAQASKIRVTEYNSKGEIVWESMEVCNRI